MPKPAQSQDTKVLRIARHPEESVEKSKARASLSPAISAAAAADPYQGNVLGKDTDLAEIVDTLHSMMKRANGGDLTDLENMLIGQANALQTMFASLARRAHAQQYQRHFEGFLALALKCQAQSRATIQAVVDIKYPRQATFVKQANIANGPQQINNGPKAISQPSHAKETRKGTNKLLEGQSNGSTNLDTSTKTATTGSNQEVEALEYINWPQERCGQEEILTKCKEGFSRG